MGCKFSCLFYPVGVCYVCREDAKSASSDTLDGFGNSTNAPFMNLNATELINYFGSMVSDSKPLKLLITNDTIKVIERRGTKIDEPKSLHLGPHLCSWLMVVLVFCVAVFYVARRRLGQRRRDLEDRTTVYEKNDFYSIDEDVYFYTDDLASLVVTESPQDYGSVHKDINHVPMSSRDPVETPYINNPTHPGSKLVDEFSKIDELLLEGQKLE